MVNFHLKVVERHKHSGQTGFARTVEQNRIDISLQVLRVEYLPACGCDEERLVDERTRGVQLHHDAQLGVKSLHRIPIGQDHVSYRQYCSECRAVISCA